MLTKRHTHKSQQQQQIGKTESGDGEVREKKVIVYKILTAHEDDGGNYHSHGGVHRGEAEG